MALDVIGVDFINEPKTGPEHEQEFDDVISSVVLFNSGELMDHAELVSPQTFKVFYNHVQRISLTVIVFFFLSAQCQGGL